LLLEDNEFLKLDLDNVVIIEIGITVGLELELEIFIVVEDSVVVENSEGNLSSVG